MLVDAEITNLNCILCLLSHQSGTCLCCMRVSVCTCVSVSVCGVKSTNRSGVEWLRRHMESRGISVHSLIFKGLQNCHADATFLPLSECLQVFSVNISVT